MKISWLLGGIIVILCGAIGWGVWFMMQEGVIGADSPNPEASGSESLVIEEVVQTRHADVAETVGCDVRILYPQISAQSEMISTEARERINDTLRIQVRNFFSASANSLDEAATAFATTCQRDLAEYVQDWNDPLLSAQEAWVSEIGYNVKLNDGKHLSVGIANYVQMGGAHPNTTELFSTFDVATGNLITLRDIVAPEDVLRFEVAEKEWLVSNQAEQMFEESLNEFSSFLQSPTQSAADTYIDRTEFYITPTSIVTFYNPYIIAPYVVGPIEVVQER